MTGTKGKTTTSSLIAAILAADPDHPVVLGGNIGIPLVERLPELTPEHRVVIELSELQLPTLSRGTTVAVYTNVTSDHLDRHGSLEGYRAAKRRLAELVDPDGALVLNGDDPVVAAYAELGARRTVRHLPARPAAAGGRSSALDAASWIVAARASGRVMPIDELAIPGRHNVSNALAAVARRAATSAIAPDAIRRAAAAFSGVEHRLEPVAIVDGVRFVNDSQGTQPDAVVAALRAFDPPIVLIAGGRDKGVDLSGARARRRRAGRGGRPDRRERAGPRGAVPRGRPRARRDGRRPSTRPSASPMRSPARAMREAGDPHRDRAAEPGRRQLRHVRGLRGPRPGVQGGGRPPQRRATTEEIEG